jgi:hypothetical protein
MKVKIALVHNQGRFDEEYVLLKVEESCDIGRYLLADSTYTTDGKVSNKLRHIYWFPDGAVKKGDLIIVWTKAGKDNTSETDSGVPIHHYYWGLKSAVWNDDGDCAALLELSTWQFFRATE